MFVANRPGVYLFTGHFETGPTMESGHVLYVTVEVRADQGLLVERLREETAFIGDSNTRGYTNIAFETPLGPGWYITVDAISTVTGGFVNAKLAVDWRAPFFPFLPPQPQ